MQKHSSIIRSTLTKQNRLFFLILPDREVGSWDNFDHPRSTINQTQTKKSGRRMRIKLSEPKNTSKSQYKRINVTLMVFGFCLPRKLLIVIRWFLSFLRIVCQLFRFYEQKIEFFSFTLTFLLSTSFFYGSAKGESTSRLSVIIMLHREFHIW